jgi:hypothetical protein
MDEQGKIFVGLPDSDYGKKFAGIFGDRKALICTGCGLPMPRLTYTKYGSGLCDTCLRAAIAKANEGRPRVFGIDQRYRVDW